MNACFDSVERRRLLFSCALAIGLAACGGAIEGGETGTASPSEADSPADGDGPVEEEGRTGGRQSVPGRPAPCRYDGPPPENPPACPSTWEEACRSSQFQCPDEELRCWYANVGDGEPGCYAHGLMTCSAWPDGDGGTGVERRCAQ